MVMGGERYTLLRSGSGWKIKENQFWILSRGTLGDAYTLDSTYWNRLDRLVEEARGERDPLALLSALREAERLPEALRLLTTIPADQKSADIWKIEFWTRYQLGESALAQNALCNAIHRGADPREYPVHLTGMCSSPTGRTK